MTEVSSYRNQSIDLRRKSMDWFLYDSDLRHERVKPFRTEVLIYFKAFEYSAAYGIMCLSGGKKC